MGQSAAVGAVYGERDLVHRWLARRLRQNGAARLDEGVRRLLEGEIGQPPQRLVPCVDQRAIVMIRPCVLNRLPVEIPIRE